jgi:hypothetical protein
MPPCGSSLSTITKSVPLPCVEDLASPGRFVFDLEQGPAVLILGSGDLIDTNVERR